MQTFYMMVGLPSSGKSFAADNIPGAIIHSSNAIRAEILGDVNRQDQQDLVFQTLHERVMRDLADGKSVIYDATNTNYKRRMAFLRRINAMNLSCFNVCVFLATPYVDCLKGNTNRERQVPESVIKRMYEHFDIPMMCEGWDAIWIEDNGYSYPSIDDTLLRLITIEHDNPHHEFSIGKHCLAAWSYLEGHYPNPDLVLSRATLLHDFGKESTKVFHNGRGNPTDIAHYYHHEHTSAYDSFTYTTDMSDEDRLKVALLVRWHMWPYVVEKSDNPSKTLRKVIQLLGEDIWKQIMVLHDCDLHAH